MGSRETLITLGEGVLSLAVGGGGGEEGGHLADAGGASVDD